MADYLVTDAELTTIADAIRTKGETSNSLVFPNGFISAIEDIPSGSGGGDVTITVTDTLGTMSTSNIYIPTTGSVVNEHDPEDFVNRFLVTVPADSMFAIFLALGQAVGGSNVTLENINDNWVVTSYEKQD